MSGQCAHCARTFADNSYQYAVRVEALGKNYQDLTRRPDLQLVVCELCAIEAVRKLMPKVPA